MLNPVTGAPLLGRGLLHCAVYLAVSPDNALYSALACLPQKASKPNWMVARPRKAWVTLYSPWCFLLVPFLPSTILDKASRRHNA